MKKDWHRIVPDVYALLLKDDQILLTKRQNTGYEDGSYSMPSGHFDGGETAREAIIRETREEVGIVLDKENLQFVHVMNRKSLNHERVDFFFVCKKWQGEIRNMEPEKCSEVGWYPIDELPKNTIPYVKFAIENFQKGNPYSEFDWS